MFGPLDNFSRKISGRQSLVYSRHLRRMSSVCSYEPVYDRTMQTSMDHLVDGTTCAMASILIKENIGYLNSPVEVFLQKDLLYK